MTETAGPQGDPPPSVGRGLWSEAFEKGGVAGLTRLSAQTYIDHKWNLNLNTGRNVSSFIDKTTSKTRNEGPVETVH